MSKCNDSTHTCRSNTFQLIVSWRCSHCFPGPKMPAAGVKSERYMCVWWLGCLPVELQHGACNRHAPRHLERHPAYQVHHIARVWMEGRVVQLLGIMQLFFCRTGGNGASPGANTDTHTVNPFQIHHTSNTLSLADLKIQY